MLEFTVTQLIAYFGGSVVVSTAVITWVGKYFLSKYINIEKHRTDSELVRLKDELLLINNKEIEAVKSKLNISVKRIEVEHLELFSKRVQVMVSLYQSFVDIRQQAPKSLHFIQAPSGPTKIREEAAKLYDQISALTNFYQKHKIFLEDEVCASINDAISKAWLPAIEYQMYLGNYDDHELHSIQDVRDRSWDQISNELLPAIKEVEDRFRRLFLAHMV